ncbi:hypothetical protein N0V83_004915 [Neocucurbitaria cava]|uniref:Uncharacterized protein n=1 Tax=Neocucurbitaria cava TaxID=798079 RepID=A0A9W8Y8S6_9PLEO|nr:hypothetical protein N0V83_004915 [Neocucurbitaria cava]
MRGYTKAADEDVKTTKVLDISKELYGLLAQPREGLSYDRPRKERNGARQRQEFGGAEIARQEGAALVARRLLQSHPDVTLCLPIRFNLPHCFISAGGATGSGNSPFPTVLRALGYL